jgi:hypothetical protein
MTVDCISSERLFSSRCLLGKNAITEPILAFHSFTILVFIHIF